jgi:hypothetical protein
MRVRAFAGSRAYYQRARVSRFCFFRVQRRTSWLHYLPSKRCQLQLFGFDLSWALGRLLQAMECLLYSFRIQCPRTLFLCSRLPLPPPKVSLVHPRAILLRLALPMVKFHTGSLLPDSILLMRSLLPDSCQYACQERNSLCSKRVRVAIIP